MVRNALRTKLRNGQSTLGLWVTLESPNVTEVAVELGLDWVVIEMEHGHLDWREVIEHVRLVSGTETSALVRSIRETCATLERQGSSVRPVPLGFVEGGTNE